MSPAAKATGPTSFRHEGIGADNSANDIVTASGGASAIRFENSAELSCPGRDRFVVDTGNVTSVVKTVNRDQWKQQTIEVEKAYQGLDIIGKIALLDNLLGSGQKFPIWNDDDRSLVRAKFQEALKWMPDSNTQIETNAATYRIVRHLESDMGHDITENVKELLTSLLHTNAAWENCFSEELFISLVNDLTPQQIAKVSPSAQKALTRIIEAHKPRSYC